MEAMSGYRRSESRRLRPFVSLEHFLTESEIRIADGEWLHFDDPYFCDDGEIISDISLRIPAIRESDLASTGYKIDDMELIVVQSVRPRLHSQVVKKMRASELTRGNNEIEINLHTPFSELSTGYVEVAMVLAELKPRAGGKAYRKGSRISSARFRFASEPRARMFGIIIRDPEWFEDQMNLSKKTSYLIRLNGDVRSFVADPSEIVEVTVSSDIVSPLERRSNSNRGAAVNNAILTDVLAHIVHSGFEQSEELPDEQTVLWAAVSTVSRGLGITREALVARVLNQEYSFVHALVQGATGSVDMVKESLR